MDFRIRRGKDRRKKQRSRSKHQTKRFATEPRCDPCIEAGGRGGGPQSSGFAHKPRKGQQAEDPSPVPLQERKGWK